MEVFKSQFYAAYPPDKVIPGFSNEQSF